MRKSFFYLSIQKLHRHTEKKSLTIAEILDDLGKHSHLVAIALFSLPFLQPIPLPGLSVVLGIVICVISFFILAKRPPWLPKKILNWHLSAETLLVILKLAEKIISKIEQKIHKRWPLFYRGRLIFFVNMTVIFLNAILLALPLPIPFTNGVPAIVILLNSFGQLEEDGLVLFSSYIACMMCFVFFAIIVRGAELGFSYLNM